ncbi:UDP-glucose dehydrogenase family protein [Bacillus dakarensis]|uniref:UDP-glucose dehydrogenase family protein n=1 Tax=Robertmurraya dakarensis TaxID=1926278 RepID=UPI00098100A0|nr:UDP-glucose/GDP-mannose dehydrogenase family protein [Bacillus dakarensis]
MKITVLGTGYVGLSTGVCLAEIGHNVTCIDVNTEKIDQLNKGISPIYEPGLESLLVSNMGEGRLEFTTSHQKGFERAEVIIIAVGTPQTDEGAANLVYLEQAAKDIAQHLKHDAIVVIKSTVPVGTNEYIKTRIKDGLESGVKIEIVSNPEFLRQGSAVQDTLRADRIVIGADNKFAAEKIAEMYRPMKVPVLQTTIRSAELIKYASNAFLATKISFINEMANLCEAVGANVEDVAEGMGRDQRIGSAFLQAGIGYGGSCFPKDTAALVHTARKNGVPFAIVKETIETNQEQQKRLVSKALKRFGDIKGKKFAMLGLAFKPETDDMREAPSIIIVKELVRLGASVSAYDPVAMGNAQKVIGDEIEYASNAFEAIADADALMIVTEWNEFKNLDLQKALDEMKQPIIFDGRNCFREEQLEDIKNIEYYPVGKPPFINSSNK